LAPATPLLVVPRIPVDRFPKAAFRAKAASTGLIQTGLFALIAKLATRVMNVRTLVIQIKLLLLA
jgi:hypothetical protein